MDNENYHSEIDFAIRIGGEGGEGGLVALELEVELEPRGEMALVLEGSGDVGFGEGHHLTPLFR